MTNKLENMTSKEAAKILNIHPETLRKWEASGKLGFEASRTDGGHRRYPKDKVLLLREQLGGSSNYAVKVIKEEAYRESEELGNGLVRHYFNDGTGESVVQGGPDPEFWLESKVYDQDMFSDHKLIKKMTELENKRNNSGSILRKVFRPTAQLSVISIAGRGENTVQVARKSDGTNRYLVDANILYGNYAGGQASYCLSPQEFKTLEGMSHDEAVKHVLDFAANYSMIAEIDENKNGWLYVKKTIALEKGRLEIPEGFSWFRRALDDSPTVF